LGVTLENPQAYLARYGAQLLDAQTLVQQARAAGVVEDISPPLVAAAGLSSSSFSQESSFGAGGAELVGFAGGELGGASSSYSSSSFDGSQVGGAGVVGLEAGLAGGVGAGYGASSYESSSFSSSAGGVGGGVGGGFDVAGAVFNSADTNKDGRLDATEFNNFAQGGL
jgi:hypothetical protein